LPRARKRTCLAPPPASDSPDRRQTPRYRCRLTYECYPISLVPLQPLGTGQVADISTDGIRVLLGRPVPAGTFLALSLHTHPGQLVRQLRARVIRSSRPAPGSGQWIIGCKLSPVLSEAELDALL
jgi:hypothetical protein